MKKSKKIDKHLGLDQDKIKRVKRLLNAKTEAEAIEEALDIILTEEEIYKFLKKVGGKGHIEKSMSRSDTMMLREGNPILYILQALAYSLKVLHGSFKTRL